VNDAPRWFNTRTLEEVMPENIKYSADLVVNPDLLVSLGKWCEVPGCSNAPDLLYKDDRARLWHVCEEHAGWFGAVNDRR
jgi:hypothetical protein